MKIINKTCMSFLIVIFLSLAGCVTHITKSSDANTVAPRSDMAIDSKSRFVVVDSSESAFIVFTGIPKSIGGDQLEKIKQMVSSRETLTMLSWDQFLDGVNSYAHALILTNDYPDVRLIDGLVCLLASEKGSGIPWGLVWNGGIALTFNDYQHARRTYISYKGNPMEYQPIQDPRMDPINPSGHLSFAGCN